MSNVEINLKKVLEQELYSLYALRIDTGAIKIEYPTLENHGDLATNIALSLSKELHKSPLVICNELKIAIESNPLYLSMSKDINKLEVASPGFLNFYFTLNYLIEGLVKINSDFGKGDLKNYKIMVEYGDPNTHKLPHIGHLFSYIAGDCIAKILELNGNEVIKVIYRSDVGPNIAKSLYGWIKKGKPVPESLEDKVKLLQLCYQEGATAYEEDEKAKAEIKKINLDIYNPNSAIQKDWLLTRKWSLDYYLELEKTLGTKPTINYLESEVWKKGVEIVEENIGKVFEKSEGAIIFPGERYGLHTRVFLTKELTPTYETKELGLSFQKMLDWPFDLSIIPTASEQNAYFAVVIEAINLAIPKLKGKLKHIGFGMVSLTTGKMASRKGNILSALDLIDQVLERVEVIMQQREGLSPAEKKLTAQKVGIGAIKYAFLRGNILGNMAFDIDESISFEGNSGPYLQYTYARIHSLLNQSKVDLLKLDPSVLIKQFTSLEELTLLKWLVKYPVIVESAANNYSPHLVANYLFELAQRFNSFYKLHSINSAPTPELISSRRLIAEKTALVLKLGLNLLGIEVVDKM